MNPDTLGVIGPGFLNFRFLHSSATLSPKPEALIVRPSGAVEAGFG